MQEKKIDRAFDLGTWLGRRQAFSIVAGRCSAADAQCLQNIRENKLYRALGMNWEKFCRQHAGVSRPTADRIIRQLEEFGAGYFALAAVTGVTPPEYRLIAGAVSEQGVSHGGETIPILPENAPRLTAAIEDLRRHAETPAPVAEQSIQKAERLLRTALKAFEHLHATPLELGDRLRLQSVLGSGIDTLRSYADSVRT
jgi:hypothetical protein